MFFEFFVVKECGFVVVCFVFYFLVYFMIFFVRFMILDLICILFNKMRICNWRL